MLVDSINWLQNGEAPDAVNFNRALKEIVQMIDAGTLQDASGIPAVSMKIDQSKLPGDVQENDFLYVNPDGTYGLTVGKDKLRNKTIGMYKVINSEHFLIPAGRVEVQGADFTVGSPYYLSDDVPGGIGLDEFAPQVGIAISATELVIVSSGSGGGSSAPGMLIHTNIVDTDVEIPPGSNAVSAGDITINDGVTVTIPDGSNWVIV